jgi:hypothetical protein
MADLHRRSGLRINPRAEPILNDKSGHFAKYDWVHHIRRRNEEHTRAPKKTVHFSILHAKAGCEHYSSAMYIRRSSNLDCDA